MPKHSDLRCELTVYGKKQPIFRGLTGKRIRSRAVCGQKDEQKRCAHGYASLYRVVRGDGQGSIPIIYEAYSPEGDLLVSVLFRSTWSSYCFFNQPCCSFIHSIIDSCDFNSAITVSSARSLLECILPCLGKSTADKVPAVF